MKLTAVSSLEDFEKGTNVYFYNAAPNLNRFSTPGTEMAKVVIKKNPQLLVKLGKADVVEQGVEVVVNGFEFAPENRLAVSSGSLQAPKAVVAENGTGVFTLTPSWEKVANADFYEVEFGDMLYSTIRDTEFTFDELQPETTYSFKVRAVNKDGYSPWTTVSGTTQSNPLEWAVKDIKATCTAEGQGGQGVSKLFDFDTRSGAQKPFRLT